MNRIALIIMMFVCAGCQEQHEKIINKYMDQYLKDPGSYEFIEMESPKIITPMSMAISKMSGMVRNGELSLDSVNIKLEQIKEMFESNGTNPYDTLGWTVKHSYRAKNSYGAYEISNITFTLDKNMKEIINVEHK